MVKAASSRRARISSRILRPAGGGLYVVSTFLFGRLSDRWGRRPALMLTILFYSVFSGLTCFVNAMWQVAILRFLVAMGVGGEWSVATRWKRPSYTLWNGVRGTDARWGWGRRT